MNANVNIKGEPFEKRVDAFLQEIRLRYGGYFYKIFDDFVVIDKENERVILKRYTVKRRQSIKRPWIQIEIVKNSSWAFITLTDGFVEQLKEIGKAYSLQVIRQEELPATSSENITIPYIHTH